MLVLPSRRAPDGYSESHYVPSSSQLRAAILEAIDDGDPATKQEGDIRGLPWALDHVFADTANDARLRFCDAVEERLRR